MFFHYEKTGIPHFFSISFFFVFPDHLPFRHKHIIQNDCTIPVSVFRLSPKSVVMHIDHYFITAYDFVNKGSGRFSHVRAPTT